MRAVRRAALTVLTKVGRLAAVKEAMTAVVKVGMSERMWADKKAG
jgi:hypothetical protein